MPHSVFILCILPVKAKFEMIELFGGMDLSVKSILDFYRSLCRWYIYNIKFNII